MATRKQTKDETTPQEKLASYQQFTQQSPALVPKVKTKLDTTKQSSNTTDFKLDSELSEKVYREMQGKEPRKTPSYSKRYTDKKVIRQPPKQKPRQERPTTLKQDFVGPRQEERLYSPAPKPEVINLGQTRQQRELIQRQQQALRDQREREEKTEFEKYSSPQIGETGYTPLRRTITDDERQYLYERDVQPKEEKAARQLREGTERTPLQTIGNIWKTTQKYNPVTGMYAYGYDLLTGKDDKKGQAEEIQEAERVSDILTREGAIKGWRSTQPQILQTPLQKEREKAAQEMEQYGEDIARYSSGTQKWETDKYGRDTAKPIQPFQAQEYSYKLDEETGQVIKPEKELTKKQQEKIYTERGVQK